MFTQATLSEKSCTSETVTANETASTNGKSFNGDRELPQ